MKRTLMLLTCSTALAGPPPPPPDGGTTNNPSPPIPQKPRQPVHGAIHTTEIEYIEWWNLKAKGFEVEWRASLTDGTWTNIGSAYKKFEHGKPEGFYRVLESSDVVFPVWNSGTADMEWTATSDSPYVSLECLNTNIPPEWGEGYIWVTPGVAPGGTVAVIEVVAGVQTQQVTIVWE